MKKIRIATRGSHLALAQAKYVENLLQKKNYETEIVIIKTTGDINYASFSELAKKGDETKGLFTKEIEEALLNHLADIAVHSLKDLPTKSPEELVIAALPQRLDFRDYWIFPKSKKIQDQFPYIKSNGKIGTSSLRRKSLLKYLCPSLEFIDIRGNVPTRIKKLFAENGPDAILLSGAGIERLSKEKDWIEKELLEKIEMIPLDPEWFPPAPGQGTIAVQCRKNDQEIIKILQDIHNKEIEEIINIERGLLSKLEGGCHLPLGIHAKKTEKDNLYQANIFLGKDYPYTKKNKDFYFTRYHKDKNKLVEFLYEELTKEIPIVIFGKKQKKEILKQKFNKDNIYFINIMDIIYYDNFIKNIINNNTINIQSYTIYAIFSAEGIRSLKKQNFQFDKNDIIALNGKKSKEILLQNFPEINTNNLILSEDGTASGIAKKIINLYKPQEVKIIAITAKESRDEFFELLQKQDYFIERWITYETKTRILDKKELQSLPVNAYFIFGSPSLFDAFYNSLRENNIDKNIFLNSVRFISLGKTTFQHILRYNIPVYAMAKEPDYEKIIQELV
ncbi:MAG: hypothetical protein KatS3mg129_1242 [Leptospiraceae bacterium]|nr:MAG: hypothetical protein KatS3mg129_1242 [Leptospiraceae bacterium]